jgi:hypothetical protein
VPAVDLEQVARVAERLRAVRIEPDPFTDPDLYPPAGEDPERVARYFIVMVAMDHRLSRPGQPYEARLGGKLYHGADLLYRLGAEMYRRDPDFFSPQRLARIALDEVRRWLCVDSICPSDVERRTALLRDLGAKLLALYGGSAASIADRAKGRLYGEPESPGFIDLLRAFTAYQDPVDKKAMLLAKFLERRGILRVSDRWEKRIPVDNHVARIAYRLGLVQLEEELYRKLVSRKPYTPHEDVLVRMVVREAWWLVARRAGVDPFLLDDLLWTMGRRVCRAGSPRCRECGSHPACIQGACVFQPICPVGLGLRPPISEHAFYDTWWY